MLSNGKSASFLNKINHIISLFTIHRSKRYDLTSTLRSNLVYIFIINFTCRKRTYIHRSNVSSKQFFSRRIKICAANFRPRDRTRKVNREEERLGRRCKAQKRERERESKKREVEALPRIVKYVSLQPLAPRRSRRSRRRALVSAKGALVVSRLAQPNEHDALRSPFSLSTRSYDYETNFTRVLRASKLLRD